MGLREIVFGCLGNSVDREHLKRLIDVCHTMALAYLRMKASSGKLYMIRGERLEDLAWDFIADLFEKNSDGELVKMHEYFSGREINELNDHEIKIELRKLVFTKVEDNIFRAVGEKDPSLRKIIRNLKLAIRDNDCKHRVCYEAGIIIVGNDERQNLPVMPSEFMQIKLCSRVEEKMQIPEILVEVIDVLQSQNKYRKRFSLVALASVIRDTYVHFNEAGKNRKEKPKAEQHVLNTEFELFLKESAEMVKTKTGYSYIRKGKVTHEELDHYMSAAKDVVRDYFNDGKTEFSQYEYLKNYMPSLEYEEFREDNRQILEYIVKLIRKELVKTFKKDWC